ncbi:MAG: hypothetical protein R3C99_18145 [Pirellulaceae bacterium]
MIGGFILSDNLGLGSKPSDMVPRLATVAVLLIGKRESPQHDLQWQQTDGRNRRE